MLRRALRFLESPRLAIVLLVYLASASAIATMAAQGAQRSAVYSAWYFVGPALLLLGSTAACAMRRTRVSAARLKQVRALEPETAARLARQRGRDVGTAQGEGSLGAAAVALRELGFRQARVQGRVVVAQSSAWALMASPVFHWLLVSLLIVVLFGRMARAEGLMGVPVGGERPNIAASYGVIDAGALYRWPSAPLRIAVPSFEVDYVSDGIDRGPTPFVKLLSADGSVLAAGKVYPNNALTHNGVMIHASDYGLSPKISLVTPGGEVVATQQLIADFDPNAALRIAPAETVLTDAAGKASVRLSVQLYPERRSGRVVKLVPKSPKALLVATDAENGSELGRATVTRGGALQLEQGSVRFDSVGYYARISVVDDRSVGALYFLFFAAIAASAVALLTTPRFAVVAVDEAGVVRVHVRFYRPSAVTPADVYDALRSVLGGDGQQGEGAVDAD
ncbi:MAG TPA: cytochrome c biogenesis protein ResB [Coriobacteriia bacterium]|nr:cytochrome c biogenesis protein ResB [Coriobacteriia bacterium]